MKKSFQPLLSFIDSKIYTNKTKKSREEAAERRGSSSAQNRAFG